MLRDHKFTITLSIPSYRNQAQDYWTPVHVTGRGRSIAKRPLLSFKSPNASRVAIGEYSKLTLLLANIVQPVGP